jgi:hypothetical protein
VQRVIVGVAEFNLILVVVGYFLLASLLQGRSPLTWLTFAGIALLVGASAVGLILGIAAVAGSSTGPVPLAIASAALSLGGLLMARFAPERWRRRSFVPQHASESRSPLAIIVSTAGAYGVAAVCGLMLFAAFRSSPWLDDSWTFWLPKGIDLAHAGLDHRRFTEDPTYVQFTNLSYPIWWSVITGLAMRFVGTIDLRAVDAQLALLLVAFFGAAARLLWGWVRPWILWPSLLLLAASPELLHQSQSGGADLPLAVYFALTVLAAVGWLVRRQTLFLVLVAVFGAAAASIKVEGPTQLIILVAIPAVLCWRMAPERVRALLTSLAAGLLIAAPWFVWTRVHGLHAEFSLADAVDPSYLASQAERIGPSAHAVGHHLVNPREWLLVMPALVAAAAVAAAAERRAVHLLPIFICCLGYLFWIWIYWSGSIDLTFWLDTSSYRVVDSLLLAAGASLPLLLERLASRWDSRRTSAWSR